MDKEIKGSLKVEQEIRVKVDKLMKRYPDGFDSERSVHRPEYEGGNFNG